MIVTGDPTHWLHRGSYEVLRIQNLNDTYLFTFSHHDRRARDTFSRELHDDERLDEVTRLIALHFLPPPPTLRHKARPPPRHPSQRVPQKYWDITCGNDGFMATLPLPKHVANAHPLSMILEDFSGILERVLASLSSTAFVTLLAPGEVQIRYDSGRGVI